MAAEVVPTGEEAASIAPAGPRDRVGVQQAAALQRDRLPRDPTAQRLPRPAIRVLALPMRAGAEMPIARGLQMRIERQPEIAGQLMPEGARRGPMPRA